MIPKKPLSIAVAFALLVLTCFPPILVFAEDNTFISIDDFNYYFNRATYRTYSDHAITTDNVTFSAGTIRDTFRVTVLDGILEMHISTPHRQNPEDAQPDINSISLFYIPDGESLSATHFIYAIGEIAMATGAIHDPDDIDGFVTELGILDNLVDGESGSTIVNGLEYSYMISSIFGIWFFVELPD